MSWWSWRPGHAGDGEPEGRSGIPTEANVRIGAPAQREPEHDCVSVGLSTMKESLPGKEELSTIKEMPATVAPVTLRRVGDALDLLDVRFLADGDGSLLAMWERHAVLFTLEGPDDEILVIRARPHSTVPPDWADRAYRVVNEWNHTRRFCKAYVGDPTERGQLPIYAELQVPLSSGAHDALLVELLDCGAAVATKFVDWLHDEGALL